MAISREKKHMQHLIWKFGPKAADHYYAQLEAQGGGCAICGMVPEPGARRLSQDHHWETGQLRGVLCVCCNQTLGIVDESIDRLIRFADYLRHWQAFRETTKMRRGVGSLYKRGSDLVDPVLEPWQAVPREQLLQRYRGGKEPANGKVGPEMRAY